MCFWRRFEIVITFLKLVLILGSYGKDNLFSNLRLRTISPEQALDLAKVLIILPINETVKKQAIEMFERERPSIKKQIFEWVLQNFNRPLLSTRSENKNIGRQAVSIEKSQTTSSNRNELISDLPGASFWAGSAAQPKQIAFNYNVQNEPAHLNHVVSTNVTLGSPVNADINPAALSPARILPATLNPAAPELKLKAEMAFQKNDGGTYYGDYKQPSWDGVEVPTMPGLITTPYVEEPPKTTPVFKEHPVVAKVKQDMVQHNLRYIAAFASEMCHIVATKLPSEIRELSVAAGITIHEYLETNRFADTGQDIERMLSSLANFMLYAPPDLMDNMATTYYHMFRNQTLARPEVLFIMQEIEDMVQIEEAAELLQTLIPLHEFPGNGINSTHVTNKIALKLLHPFFRMAGTKKRAQLLADIEAAINHYTINQEAELNENKQLRSNVTRRDTRRFQGRKKYINKESYNTNKIKSFQYKHYNNVDDTASTTDRNNILIISNTNRNRFNINDSRKAKYERNKNIHRIGVSTQKNNFVDDHAYENFLLKRKRQGFQYETLHTTTDGIGQNMSNVFQVDAANKIRHGLVYEHSLENIKSKNDVNANGLFRKHKHDDVDGKVLKDIYQNIEIMNSNLNSILLDTVSKTAVKRKRIFLNKPKATKDVMTRTGKPTTKEYTIYRPSTPTLNVPNSKRLPIKSYAHRYTTRLANHSKSPEDQRQDNKTSYKKHKPHILFHNYKNKGYHQNILQSRILPIANKGFNLYNRHIYNVTLKKLDKVKTSQRPTNIRYNKKPDKHETLSRISHKPTTIQENLKFVYKYNKNNNLQVDSDLEPMRNNQYKKFIDETKLRTGNKLLNNINEESSYSDAEKDLIFNLNDALRHNSKHVINNGRRSFVMTKKNKIKDLTSESDEEGVFKNNIYKVFGYNPDVKTIHT